MMRIQTALLRLLESVVLVAGAFPALAAETCGNLKQFASVEMTLDDFARPLVPLVIDGKQKLMMLDTGGVISTLTQRAFEETGQPRCVATISSFTMCAATGWTGRSRFLR